MALTYGFALRDSDNSADFSNAMQAVFGDGVTNEGGRFALSVSGFNVTLSSGYALAAGRWVQNDEPLPVTIQPPKANDNRTDAIAVRVDYPAKKATLEVLPDIDPDEIDVNPVFMRNDSDYCIILYFIRVRRGVTSLTPNDVTDLRGSDFCGKVVPLSDIAGDVIRVYQFLNGGIDLEVERLIDLSNAVIVRANAAILELDSAIKNAGGNPTVGELQTARRWPAPMAEWLLCDGGDVPAEYAELSSMLGGELPDIPGDRYKIYIYGGPPMEV